VQLARVVPCPPNQASR